MHSMRQRSQQRPLTIQFWGTQGVFSTEVFRLLSAVMAVHAVIVPALPGQKNPVAELRPTSPVAPMPSVGAVASAVNSTPVHLAWQQAFAVYGVHSLRATAVESLLQTLQPDIVCVACFPWRIPARLLRIPTYGFVNLHPALLPNYRGPAPLFWQLRDGLVHSGVTLHCMADTFDSGAMIAQQPLHLIEGADGPTHDQHYATVAAALLIDFLAALAAERSLESTPQSAGGSAQSWPHAADFTIDRRWSARHAYNFMRGTAEWQQPYSVLVNDRPYTLTAALGYSATATLPHALVEEGNELAIQFQPGVLYATHAGNPRISLDPITLYA